MVLADVLMEVEFHKEVAIFQRRSNCKFVTNLAEDSSDTDDYDVGNCEDEFSDR